MSRNAAGWALLPLLMAEVPVVGAETRVVSLSPQVQIEAIVEQVLRPDLQRTMVDGLISDLGKALETGSRNSWGEQCPEWMPAMTEQLDKRVRPVLQAMLDGPQLRGQLHAAIAEHVDGAQRARIAAAVDAGDGQAAIQILANNGPLAIALGPIVFTALEKADSVYWKEFAKGEDEMRPLADRCDARLREMGGRP